MSGLCLRGMTWSHSRALPPLVAAAQRFEELHPQIRIVWETRSLDEFGHASLAELARTYDLVIVDHPMLGEAHRNGTLADLRSRLLPAELAEVEADALGECLASYHYEGCLYALPVDAATPAASYRSDLLDRNNLQLPETWDQIIELARRGLVRMPGFPADLFLNFMGMCLSRGSSVAGGDQLYDNSIAMRCLEELRELASYMPNSIYELNPIGLYEAMSAGNEFAYCPFAYTYSNYSRPGFAANTLAFTNSVQLEDGTPLRTVLGGTGIAISAACAQKEEATAFCLFVAGRKCQSHLYGICGGQPASRSAWHSPLLNQISGNFFERTLSSIEAAYVRPRYPGYIALQRAGGCPIAAFLQRKITGSQALHRIEDTYLSSRMSAQVNREPIL